MLPPSHNFANLGTNVQVMSFPQVVCCPAVCVCVCSFNSLWALSYLSFRRPACPPFCLRAPSLFPFSLFLSLPSLPLFSRLCVELTPSPLCVVVVHRVAGRRPQRECLAHHCERREVGSAPIPHFRPDRSALVMQDLEGITKNLETKRFVFSNQFVFSNHVSSHTHSISLMYHLIVTAIFLGFKAMPTTSETLHTIKKEKGQFKVESSLLFVSYGACLPCAQHRTGRQPSNFNSFYYYI
jgi:hypothetical protein